MKDMIYRNTCMKVTIIIPNYNGQKFVKDCFDALSKQTCKDFKTLVIDNASEDGSDEYIKLHYPEVEVVRLKKNYGFSGAVNKGIDLATTPYVILLNNDTEVEEHFVEKLVEGIEEDDKIFSCSSKMINFNNREVMDDAGDLYSVVGWGFQRGVDQKTELYDQSIDIFSACAGAAIYRKSVFDEIGKFDLHHFAYLEDIDLGYRAKIQGYRNVYCPHAVVYHVGSGTSGSKYNTFKVKLAARNNLYLIYKNMPFAQFLINFPFLTAGFITKYFFFKKIGFGNDYLKGIKEGFLSLHKLQRVPYEEKNLKNYIQIEKELFKNTFVYLFDYMKRRVK